MVFHLSSKHLCPLHLHTGHPLGNMIVSPSLIRKPKPKVSAALPALTKVQGLDHGNKIHLCEPVTPKGRRGEDKDLKAAEGAGGLEVLTSHTSWPTRQVRTWATSVMGHGFRDKCRQHSG